MTIANNLEDLLVAMTTPHYRFMDHSKRAHVGVVTMPFLIVSSQRTLL